MSSVALVLVSPYRLAWIAPGNNIRRFLAVYCYLTINWLLFVLQRSLEESIGTRPKALASLQCQRSQQNLHFLFYRLQ